MTAPNSLPPLLRWLSSFLVALVVLGPGALRADGPPGEVPTAEVLSLSPGLSLEREVRGGERSFFELPLPAGTFVCLEIFPRNTALEPGLSSPDGQELIRGGDGGPQLLAVITDREGTYRLDLTAPKAQKSSTRFTLDVHELRPATAGDEMRVRGAKNLAEARRLWLQGTEEAKSRAEALTAESLTAWQASGDARGELEALLASYGFQRERGNISAALAWVEKALDKARASGLSREEARALSGKGYCLGRLGDHGKAIDSFQESLRIWRRIGDDYAKASALVVLGLGYQRQQDYESERRTFEEAVPLAEASGDLAQQGRALSGLGASYYYLGQPTQAREYWEKARDLSHAAGDERTELLVENNLAVLLSNQGQFQRALAVFTRMVPRVPLNQSGLVRWNMGNLYTELGNLEEALENYQLALEGYQASGELENEVNALVSIGRTRQKMGDPEAALSEYEKARKLLPQVPWSVFHSIGLAKVAVGQPGEAVPELQKAFEIAVETKDRSREAATLLALGMANRQLGQTELAAENLTKAIEVGEEIGYQSAVSTTFLQRALLRRDQGRLEEALADVQKALVGVESARRNILGDQSRVGFFASKRTYYDLEIDLLMGLDRAHPGQYRAAALEASEWARARGLLDLLAEGRIDVREALTPDLRRREEELSYKVSRAQSELRTGAKPERIAALQEELRQLDRHREQLDSDIRSSNKRYADLRYPVPLKLEQIQSLIPDDETALLEYALGEKRSTLFVVTRKGLDAYELPGSDLIRQRVERLRNALERNNLLTRQDYLDLGFQLYRDLLQPASSALAGKASLLIVADGVLNYVPFEALLTEPAGGRSFQELPYLLRRHSIAYVPSASVLASLRELRQAPAPAGRKEVVAFAPFATPGNGTTATRDVVRDATNPRAGRWSFSPLPGSGQEISKITGLYPEASLSFVGPEANEDAVTRNPSVAGAHRLHFATHARIDEQSPERSALVLSERPGEDGFLEVSEIFNLKFSADLAVLSACETGLGKEVTGEGLVGLSRAFFYAGVPSLVVSLWNVVDGPTPALMLDFYRDLDRVHDKAKALQAAKLSMISGGTYAHPSYWAPFILLGEPR